MTNRDIEPPEFIIDRPGPNGSIQKVPFLYQRDGETWDDFCARMKRVSDSLHYEIPDDATIPFGRLVLMCLVGLLMWWSIWRFFR